jgi:ATP-dependent RNA helicase DHX36
VYLPTAPNVRKIILSTNIAETSVTIDDVAFVVDCGRIKMTRYDPMAKIGKLQTEWVTQSSAKQRRGRAGRVQSGECWHLFSRLKYEGLSPFSDPEIKRRSLEDVVLDIKSLGVPGRALKFLTTLMDSPSSLAVANAVDLLVHIGALNNKVNEKLTLLGEQLAGLPVHPQLGKMCILASGLKCLDPILSIVSIMGEKDPFVVTRKKSKLDMIKIAFVQDTESDHLMLANVFRYHQLLPPFTIL